MPGGKMQRAPSLALVCERCDRPIYLRMDQPCEAAACEGCGERHELRTGGGMAAARGLEHCLRCGSDDLYVQKDFNKKIGLGVFAVAAILSVPTWGLSLVVATLLDFGLYFLLGDVTICYSCNTQHRGFGKNPDHGPFDLHIAEAVDSRPRAV